MPSGSEYGLRFQPEAQAARYSLSKSSSVRVVTRGDHTIKQNGPGARVFSEAMRQSQTRNVVRSGTAVAASTSEKSCIPFEIIERRLGFQALTRCSTIQTSIGPRLKMVLLNEKIEDTAWELQRFKEVEQTCWSSRLKGS